MSPLTPNVSPLRQRMIEDMRMRKFNGKTQIHYIRICPLFPVLVDLVTTRHRRALIQQEHDDAARSSSSW